MVMFKKGVGSRAGEKEGTNLGAFEYPAFGGGVWCYSEEASRRMSLSAL